MGLFACDIINSKAKRESTIDNEDWRPEEEDIELYDIVFAYALRSPWTMMIVTLDADVTVSTMKSLLRHVEPAFPAKAT